MKLRLIGKWRQERKKKKICAVNGYNCPECIYHDFLFDGVVFRGIRCRLDGEKQEAPNE